MTSQQKDVDPESILGKLKELVRVAPHSEFSNVLGWCVSVRDLIDLIETLQQRVKELEGEAKDQPGQDFAERCGAWLTADGYYASDDDEVWLPTPDGVIENRANNVPEDERGGWYAVYERALAKETQ